MGQEEMILETVLRQNWFFEAFEERHLKGLLKLAQEQAFPAGQEIILEGEPAEAFYILLEGAVSIKMSAKEHGEMVLSTLRQTGEILGWSALVEGGRSTASAECLEHTRVLFLRKKDLEDLFTQDPALGYQFMKRLAILISRRLESTRAFLFKGIS
jgi:CRP-like cAMP-binding protein